MDGDVTIARAADDNKVRDIVLLAGIFVVIVLVVALVVAALAEFGCAGDDTVQWPPEGSTRKDFCDHVPYGLGILLAPLATIVCGAAAVWRRRRAPFVLIVGLVLGLAIAVTPHFLISGTSKACPRGTHAVDFYCSH